MERRLLGKDLLLVQRAHAKYAGRLDRGGRDETTAKEEGDEEYDKENHEQKEKWMQTAVGGSVSSWPLIARKLSYSRVERHHAEMADWLCEMRKIDEVKKVKEVHHKK